MVGLVMFRPGLAQKPWLWLGLRQLWPAKDLSRAKAATHSLALAWPSPGHGFLAYGVVLDSEGLGE